jgi:general secretion pathway protein G
MTARIGSMRLRSGRAFTLVEILIVVIILGILAAIVIPQFANASEDARLSNMRTQMQTMKGCIELYRIEHRDTPPLLITDGWDVVLSKTDIDGNLDAAGKWGPYLPYAPENPLTKSTSVVAIGTPSATTTGWYYDETTGEFHGADRNGAISLSN